MTFPFNKLIKRKGAEGQRETREELSVCLLAGAPEGATIRSFPEGTLRTAASGHPALKAEQILRNQAPGNSESK